MTYRQAFEQFKEKLKKYENGKEDQADVLAMMALYKQIPHMPIRHSDGTHFCEICGNTVKSYEEYCDQCGQALLWSF